MLAEGALSPSEYTRVRERGFITGILSPFSIDSLGSWRPAFKRLLTYDMVESFDTVENTSFSSGEKWTLSYNLTNSFRAASHAFLRGKSFWIGKGSGRDTSLPPFLPTCEQLLLKTPVVCLGRPGNVCGNPCGVPVGGGGIWNSKGDRVKAHMPMSWRLRAKVRWSGHGYKWFWFPSRWFWLLTLKSYFR